MLAVWLVLPKGVPVSSVQCDGTCRMIWNTILGKGHSQYPLFFLSRIDRSPILLISRTQPQTPMQHLWAQGPLAPQVDSSLKPSCTQSSGADPPCCRNHEPSHCSQASRKKPVSWVNGLLVYQNSNFVLLLSSNRLKHISPLKREKLERSKETALPPWTAANEQTQGSTHIAAGFPGRRHWLIKPCWALLKGRCFGGGCWGRDPVLLYSGPTLHICASGCLLPLQAQGQSTAEERAPCPGPSVCLCSWLGASNFTIVSGTSQVFVQQQSCLSSWLSSPCSFLWSLPSPWDVLGKTCNWQGSTECHFNWKPTDRLLCCRLGS